MLDECHPVCIDLTTYLKDLRKRLILLVSMTITPNLNETIYINRRMIKDTTEGRELEF